MSLQLSALEVRELVGVGDFPGRARVGVGSLPVGSKLCQTRLCYHCPEGLNTSSDPFACGLGFMAEGMSAQMKADRGHWAPQPNKGS